MKIEKKYQNEYVACLPKTLETEIMKEVRNAIATLLITEEEKLDAIENANMSKVCDLEDTIAIEYV